MSQRLAPGLSFAGALLGIASFFIPQAEVQTPAPHLFSPYLACVSAAETEETETFVYQTALSLAPVLGCLMVLAGALPAAAGSPFLRWLQAGFFIAWAFTLSTLGSIFSTRPAGGAGGEESSTVALLLFAGPLVLVTGVLGRILGGSDPRATASIVRGSLGLLLVINALFYLHFLEVRWLAGAAVPLLAGILMAVAGALAWIRPGAATSTAPRGA